VIFTLKRPEKIMRASGVCGLLVYCSDYHRSHWTAISSDQWPDDVRLSDLEPRFTCQVAARVALRCARIGRVQKRMPD
jgi:hypothetical protein